MRKPLLLLVALVVMAFDQFSKYLAILKLSDGWVEKIFPGLNFTLAFNKGVAFSLFYHTGSQSPWFLIVATGILSLVILGMFFRTKDKDFLQQLALVLIFSGAVSNLFDRIYHGAVIDFIDAYVGQHHWPVFNLADCVICLGAFLLICQSCQEHKSVGCQTKAKKG
jgi:signal peptidase II